MDKLSRLKGGIIISNLQDLLSKYENTGGGSFKKVNFFSLKNDKDFAKVTILLSSEEDIAKFTKEVHELPLGGYNNKVLCLHEDCQCCKHGDKRKLKFYIPIYNWDTEQVEMWERGIAQIKAMINNIELYGDLTKCAFRIVRNGKPKSTSTTYNFMYVPRNENEVLPDNVMDDIPNIVGKNFKLILDLTPQQQIEGMTTGKVVLSSKSESGTSLEVDEEEIPF